MGESKREKRGREKVRASEREINNGEKGEKKGERETDRQTDRQTE